MVEKVKNLTSNGEWIKIVFISIVVLALLILLVLGIEKLLLFILSKIDDNKNYDEDRLLKQVLKLKGKKKKQKHYWQRDKNTGELYYCTDHWCWQYNKVNVLSGMFKRDKKIDYTDNIVVRVAETDKLNKKNKIRRYRKEFRVYFR
ncbi:hypothetical protein A5880_001532 [Enterococcus sp. 4G2_DIV0659]|uniref:Uncharacterized protein n=2 Tax=Candidatus Enterococcus mansonii TaxID=1834181 RepID=A0A242CE15_9ENTE|nr:hypothetical protein A5880_001451 [Enterococcus sp. 4G2_DIV0659]